MSADAPPPICVVCYSAKFQRESGLGWFPTQRYNDTDFMCAFHGKLHNRQDSCNFAVASSSSAALTEANLEARDFRLEFAKETLQSFKDKRDRSRSPRRLSNDSDAKAAALQDIKEARIQCLQETIQASEAINTSREETIHTLKLDQIHKETRIAILEIQLASANNTIAVNKSTIEGMQRIVRGDR